jgi:hypothetical protein
MPNIPTHWHAYTLACVYDCKPIHWPDYILACPYTGMPIYSMPTHWHACTLTCFLYGFVYFNFSNIPTIPVCDICVEDITTQTFIHMYLVFYNVRKLYKTLRNEEPYT